MVALGDVETYNPLTGAAASVSGTIEKDVCETGCSPQTGLHGRVTDKLSQRRFQFFFDSPQFQGAICP